MLSLTEQFAQLSTVQLIRSDDSRLSVRGPNEAIYNAQNSQATSQRLSIDSTLRITTTLRINRCPRFCCCQCHERSVGRTPGWLKAVLGQLMFSYTGTLMLKPCNHRPCKQQSRQSQFTYIFPTWLASKALVASSASSILSDAGACWRMKCAVVLDSNETVWRAIEAGNIKKLQQAITAGRFSPHVVNEFGKTPIYVSPARSVLPY